MPSTPERLQSGRGVGVLVLNGPCTLDFILAPDDCLRQQWHENGHSIVQVAVAQGGAHPTDSSSTAMGSSSMATDSTAMGTAAGMAALQSSLAKWCLMVGSGFIADTLSHHCVSTGSQCPAQFMRVGLLLFITLATVTHQHGLPRALLTQLVACAQACRALGMASTAPLGSASRQARRPLPAPSPPHPHMQQPQVRDSPERKQFVSPVASTQCGTWHFLCCLPARCRLLNACHTAACVVTLQRALCRRQPVPVFQGGGAQRPLCRPGQRAGNAACCATDDATAAGGVTHPAAHQPGCAPCTLAVGHPLRPGSHVPREPRCSQAESLVFTSYIMPEA
jgi:hypothetical protein